MFFWVDSSADLCCILFVLASLFPAGGCAAAGLWFPKSEWVVQLSVEAVCRQRGPPWGSWEAAALGVPSLMLVPVSAIIFLYWR